jgi:signal transduction histidine kinase
MTYIFSKFASKYFQGTGLGLYISKSIIESHGVKIWAENNSDGKGATFTFALSIASRNPAGNKRRSQMNQKHRS